ncbi:MAG: metallophosphoesterase [Acutalibacteraceae bacterium]|nr:metallophosphoesterase [Acutalibacteraceae bacterium]
MKKFISVMLCVVMLAATLCCGVSATEDYSKLQFNDDGNFRIMQVADLQDNMQLNGAVKEFLKEALIQEHPDLVVLTGDNISGGSCRTDMFKSWDKKNCETAIGQFMNIFEDYGVPVAMVFGNHDNENKLSKEELFDIYEEYDCFIGTDEGDALYGCGTYNLPIYSSKDSSKMAYNLWMFDSNTYDEVYGGYDYVHDDQVEWYVNKSNELKAVNGGESVPSMAFQHIIVKEIFDIIESGDNIEGSLLNYNGKDYVFKDGVLKAGYLKEYPCPGTQPSKQFSSMVNQGDVVAMFFGHDHNNTFEVTYQGIDLVATPGFTFNSYGNEDRGVRIIDINENDTSTYETRLVQFDDYFADNKMAMANYNMNCDYLPLWDRIKAGIFFVLTFPIKAIFGYAF